MFAARRHAKLVSSLVDSVMAETLWSYGSNRTRRAVIDGESFEVFGHFGSMSIRTSDHTVKLELADSLRVDSHTERYCKHDENLKRILSAV